MPEVDPHIPVLEKILRETQVQNKALMSMNRSLIKDISYKLTNMEGRIIILEQREKNIFDWGIYFRDRVLPQVLTVVTLAILALAFAPK